MNMTDMNQFEEVAKATNRGVNKLKAAKKRVFKKGLFAAAEALDMPALGLSFEVLLGLLEAGVAACADPKKFAMLEERGTELISRLAVGVPSAGAEDLIVILPAQADESLEAALIGCGMSCNTDRRRKVGTRHLWEGKAVAADIAALVEPVRGVVNPVRTPAPNAPPAPKSPPQELENAPQPPLSPKPSGTSPGVPLPRESSTPVDAGAAQSGAGLAAAEIETPSTARTDPTAVSASLPKDASPSKIMAMAPTPKRGSEEGERTPDAMSQGGVASDKNERLIRSQSKEADNDRA